VRVRELLVRGYVATPTIYQLGAGGMNPLMPIPGVECDCSGYVCWCLGRSRQTTNPLYVKFNRGWVNTDGMIHDAKECLGFFSLLDEPKVGCIIVYGGRASRAPRQIGHVGIVTQLDDALAHPYTKNTAKVRHCSMGNYRRTGDAIQETGPEAFRVPDVIFAWYEGIDA
jgi:hypothetical protein